MSDYLIHFDGSCGPKNPGDSAGWGYTITKDGIEYDELSGELKGETFTNNYAEFFALYVGLLRIKPWIKNTDRLFIRGDSKLVINMMRKKWKAKSGIYYPAYLKAMEQLTAIRRENIPVSLDWVPREMNTKADSLSITYRK